MFFDMQDAKVGGVHFYRRDTLESKFWLLDASMSCFRFCTSPVGNVNGSQKMEKYHPNLVGNVTAHKIWENVMPLKFLIPRPPPQKKKKKKK